MRNNSINYIHRKFPGIIETDLSVREWIDLWAPRKASSMDSVEAPQLIRQMSRILDIIGDYPIQALELSIIQNCVDALEAANYPASAYSHHFAHLSHALNDAMLRHYLAFNPCLGIRLPKFQKAQRNGLSDNEHRLFLEKCSASPYGLLYRTTLAAALRKGEVLALSWRQINFERKSIMIDQQIALRPLPDGTSHYTLVPYTKNRKRQSIHPLKEIFQPLKEEKERQLLLCLQREIPWSEESFVFNIDGKPFSREDVSKDFHQIATSIGRPDLRFHDLRHTSARLKMRESYDLWAVRDFLRHSWLGTTVSYLYTTPEDQQEGIVKLNQWFEELLQPSTPAQPSAL